MADEKMEINDSGDGSVEAGPTPHPNAGQGDDISPDQDGGVLKFIKLQGDMTEEDGPMKGDTVFVHYVGTLLNGEQFDSSRKRGQKFSFELGEGKVIKAWDIGVATMKRGEIAVLTCKPEYAYGKTGQGSIPANSTLVFEVELFDWKGKDISDDSDESIVKRTIEAGDGPTYEHPGDESTVEIHLTGKYQGNVFEDRDVKFILNEGSEQGIVEGVERGLMKMNKGEKAILKMKSKYAFGENGKSEFNIPPSADVEYIVHLKEYEKVKESWEMDAPEKLEAAAKAKEKGTAYFKAGNYPAAIKKWTKIISLLEFEHGFKDEEKPQSVALQLAANLNLSLAYINSGDNLEAIKVCDKAIELDSKSEKGHFRRGQAYFAQKEYDLAKADYAKVVELSPENKAARNQLTICTAKIKEELRREKKLYQNMFNKIIQENEQKEKEEEAKREQQMKDFQIDTPAEKENVETKEESDGAVEESKMEGTEESGSEV